MSPHYTSVRDGNAVAIPPAYRPAAYQAPAFRVETLPSSAEAEARPFSGTRFPPRAE
jgi:hypothetical protein